MAEEIVAESTGAGAAEEPYRKLRIYNGVMAVFHLVQGLLMLALSNDFSLPVTTNYLKADPADFSGPSMPSVVGHLRIGPLVAAFLFMSALAHFLLTLPRIYEWYVRNLKKGANYARWVEYSFSASLMIVIIAMLSGVYDLSTLILLFFMNMMMILFGWMMELHNQSTEKTNWTSFYFGCLAGIIPWVVIALYFFSAVSRPEAGVPTFVYFILPILFVFFNCFAVNMVLQYRKVGKWRDYLFGEKVYILLSLLAKSALAWQVFGGTLRGS
ncbi:MAG: heliorhodopsin HeR [Actinobacteria bacterium]|nr:heliorhodopsin HeR [Actinomycetota bacterium]